MVGNSSKPVEVPSNAADSEYPLLGEYSSPPCFMHELGPDFVSPEVTIRSSEPCAFEISASDWPSVRRWRKETRTALIERRLGIHARDRVVWSERIRQALEAAVPSASEALIGFYWPFRGEFDARPLLTEMRGKGARLALPVVVEKACPLQFRAWSPGDRMIRGVWNIPIPAASEPVHPDVLIAPLVGFDPSGYRLGYGGGFYDRTIVSEPKKPLVIGVGFALARLATIYPQAHDIPMDVVVTEDSIWQPQLDLAASAK